MKVFLTGALLAGAVLSATPAGAANLVLNPGFETGDLSDWVASVGGDGFDLGVDQYALDVHGGAWGAYMGNATTTTLAQSIATTAGATYLVSFWLDVYQSQAFDGGFSASFGGQAVADLVEPAETDAFVQYSAVVTATSGSSQLVFTGSDPGGWFGLDDISVTQLTSGVPEPAPAWLMLLGLGVAGTAARRRR